MSTASNTYASYATRGHAIQGGRARFGWSREDLSAMTGIEVYRIKLWEDGEPDPKGAYWMILADELMLDDVTGEPKPWSTTVHMAAWRLVEQLACVAQGVRDPAQLTPHTHESRGMLEEATRDRDVDPQQKWRAYELASDRLNIITSELSPKGLEGCTVGARDARRIDLLSTALLSLTKGGRE